MRRTASCAATDRAHHIDGEHALQPLGGHLVDALRQRNDTPALLTSPSSRPKVPSMVEKMEARPSSVPTSPCTGIAEPPSAPDIGDHGLGCLEIGGIVHRHLPARGARHAADTGTDAAAAAGNEKNRGLRHAAHPFRMKTSQGATLALPSSHSFE
jgi:hypothetical protein